MRFLVPVSAIAIAFFPITSVLAWGDGLAHPAIGELAQTMLTANGLKLVQSVLDTKFNGSLGGQTCNWADAWRSSHSSTSAWHFVDMAANPPQQCGYTPSDCSGGNCVIGAITTQTQQLLGTNCAPSTTNAQALQFIAHFIGDITQPLHACARDRGGNDDTVTFDGSSTNFHAIHDTQIPVKRSKEVGKTSAVAYSRYLAETYSAKSSDYTSKDFVDFTTVDSAGNLQAAINMGQDSNALDCSKSGFWTLYDADPEQDFGGSYFDAVKLPLEEQMAKAGYRLAAWTNAIADRCYNKSSSQTVAKRDWRQRRQLL